MKHLDERVTELADEQLDHDERDRAFAHLAVCEQCRGAVDDERTAKSALRSLSGPEPSAALVTTLLKLAEPGGPLPPEQSRFAAAPVAGWREPGKPAAKRRKPRLGLAPRSAKVATAGVLSASGVVALLTAMGGQPGDTAHPDPAATGVVPPADAYIRDHAEATGGLPFGEPAAFLVPAQVAADDDR